MPPAESLRSDSLPPKAEQSAFDPRSDKIFGHVFEFFGVLDLNGRIQTLTGRIFQRTNTDTNLLAGQRFSETVFWQSSENTARLVEKAVADASEGIDTSLRLDFRISAEEKIPVELQLLLLRDETSPSEIFVSGRALSGKDPATSHEIENEQLLWAAENAGIGLWFWDMRDERMYSTPSCNELLGLPTYDRIAFESFLTVVHPDDRPRVEKLFRRLLVASARYEEEFRVTRTDGTVDWISAEGRSISNGEGTPIRMMGIVRNVTEQRIASEELARVYDREKRCPGRSRRSEPGKRFLPGIRLTRTPVSAKRDPRLGEDPPDKDRRRQDSPKCA